MLAEKVIAGSSELFDTDKALEFRRLRKINKDVREEIAEVPDDKINDYTVDDIIALSLNKAEKEADSLEGIEIPDAVSGTGELEEIFYSDTEKQEDSIEAKVQEERSYFRLLKRIGSVGSKMLSYAMIPLKYLYEAVVKRYVGRKSMDGSVKKAIHNHDITIGELNEKIGYSLSDVRKKISSVITYMVAGILGAVIKRSEYEKAEKRKRTEKAVGIIALPYLIEQVRRKKEEQEKFQQKMQDYLGRVDTQSYEWIFPEPTKVSEPLVYVSSKIKSLKQLAVVKTAVVAYMNAENAKYQRRYDNWAMSSLWRNGVNTLIPNGVSQYVRKRMKQSVWRAGAKHDHCFMLGMK